MKRIDHYTKKPVTVELLTLDEIKALRYGDHAKIIGNRGDILNVKINGKVRTWKRDAARFEVPVKYGMYEYDTVTCLTRLVKIVNS